MDIRNETIAQFECPHDRLLFALLDQARRDFQAGLLRGRRRGRNYRSARRLFRSMGFVTALEALILEDNL